MLPNQHNYFQSNWINFSYSYSSQFFSFSHLHQMQYKCLKNDAIRLLMLAAVIVYDSKQTLMKNWEVFLVLSENALCLLQPCSGAVLNSWLHILYRGGEIPDITEVKHEHWTHYNKKHKNLQQALHDWGQNSTEHMYYCCCDFMLTAKHAVLAVIVKSG